ncbi:hypothetical protein PSSM2_089 [Prochlorococcus phage P-SSM2]|jgi:hypothetical protein|uniref:Uncharacterized protein n=2 Tax=Salacisavirus pssm2 TaxID=2734140 RepID=Q58MR5_BPPRM|nr:hypothetical protein PSSM2_089 [Prochlorococcus phage P-SSM2]AAX44467.1 hypothetical protein PSSM2_089 [Prochlorococcus phage P-SSM2]ACY75964.1 conserved hypothetical protein [Prochlorococcus phage P-SSM2]AGN12186.1 hypothetical protein PRTG_00028 [Prochlorococcus phage P-SSM5]
MRRTMTEETKLICALTEGEISTILHSLQVYAHRHQTTDEIERVFEELEGVVDVHYDKTWQQEFIPNFHD